MHGAPAGLLAWVPNLDDLGIGDNADGVLTLRWNDLRARIQPLRRRSGRRRSIENPADRLLSELLAADAVAVRGVRLPDVDALRDLHDFVLVPVLRAGAPLAIECDQQLDDLDDAAFVEEAFEYPYTLERARWLVNRGMHEDVGDRADRGSVLGEPKPLDPAQTAAVTTLDGVVQVIAPAGSGKTTVLVERVRELLARGADPNRILCTTFNDAAAQELKQRLVATGLGTVNARTFHSTGNLIISSAPLRLTAGLRLFEEGFTVAQWGRFSNDAARKLGLPPVEATELPDRISHIRLAELASPQEWRARAPIDDESQVVAEVYSIVEEVKRHDRLFDFDDMLLWAIRALRERDDVRRHWQQQFDHVLVDEYQDIEPAQELLVRTLAAPQDNYFAVGDEDQTLYGWRRASVSRIVDLDAAYPSLRRFPLVTNYRCPPEVVRASAALIACNSLRFEKIIRPPADAPDGGPRAVRVADFDSVPDTTSELARKLSMYTRADIAVLTRTTNALRDVAVACAARGVKITGPESLFETRGAMETLEAYLHVLTGPKKATPEQVGIILKRPSRSLGRDAARLIAEQLRAGRTIAQAVDALRIEDRQRTRRDVLRDLLVRLAAFKEAGDFIGQLRASGLDAFYEERQAAFGAPDDDQLAVLAEAQQEAAGMTPLEYLEALQERRAGLQGVRDDRHGIELTTVHRSKGRQWPRVIIWSCEEGVMPHTRSLQVSDEQRAAGEGLEAERRIAYVAFTRAQQELSILHRSGRHSRFLNEAKLVAQPATLAQPSAERPDSRAGFWAQRANGAAARSATPTSGSTAARRRSQAEPPELSTALANGRRIGLSYALRTAKDGAAARAVAAHVLRRNLFGEMAAGQNMSFTEIVRAMDEVTPATQREMLRAMPAGNIDTPARQLTATDRQRAADIIETTPDAGGDRRADDPNSDIPY